MKFVHWLVDHWWLAVGAVVALAVLIFSSIKDEGREILDAELEAIEAKRQARDMGSKMERDRVLATLDASHAETIKQIDTKAAAKVVALRRSPARYNAELTKLGRRLRRSRRGG